MTDGIGSEVGPFGNAFLAFLDRDMLLNPQHIRPVSALRFDRARELTRDVVVSDAEVFPDDILP